MKTLTPHISMQTDRHMEAAGVVLVVNAVKCFSKTGWKENSTAEKWYICSLLQGRQFMVSSLQHVGSANDIYMLQLMTTERFRKTWAQY